MSNLINFSGFHTSTLTTVGNNSLWAAKGTDPVCPAATSAAVHVSLIARQLSEAADRAEIRDRSLGRVELAEWADKMWDALFPEDYDILDSTRTPDTDDPHLLHRAKRATEYVINRVKYGPSSQSPFEGLTRNQLSLIKFDDSGVFTADERRAASYQYTDLDNEIRIKMMNASVVEKAETGKEVQWHKDILQYYRTLPPIIQCTYPANYEEMKLKDIEREVNSDPARIRLRIPKLFETLEAAGFFEVHDPGKVKGRDDEPDQSAPQGGFQASTVTTNNLSPGASPTQADARRS